MAITCEFLTLSNNNKQQNIMEMILLVEFVSGPRPFVVTNNHGATETIPVTIVVGSTASGRISCYAFSDVSKRLEEDNIGAGSVLVVDIGFRVSDFNRVTEPVGKFWHTDLRLNNYVQTCKRPQPEIY